MSYDPDKNYRCTIIRGKSQREMDDMLLVYAGIIDSICPCKRDEFDRDFNDRLSQGIFKKSFAELTDANKKTIRNHITETAGSLLGLYWHDEEENIYESDSCRKLLEDNDQPAFFKNLCLNFQFPNASQKIQTVEERIHDGVRLKPFHFVVTILSLAKAMDMILSKDEIAYYVLGNYDVLCGQVHPQEVLQTICKRREQKIEKKLPSGSRDNQHIKEQLNLLELANIIRQSDGYVFLNSAEAKTIQLFITGYNTELNFDIFSYDLQDQEQKKKMYSDWSCYYGEIHVPEVDLQTSLNALQSKNSATENASSPGQSETGTTDSEKPEDSTTVIGDAGEQLIFEMEKARVRKYSPRLENKVLLLGKQRGLGYDIASVEADENEEEPEFARFIEVKATKRTTAPDMDDTTWIDTVNLTRKEWIAAKQYRSAYNIYRVYFTPVSAFIRKITDPYSKSEQKVVTVLPTMYRMDFSATAIDKEYHCE